MSNKRKGPARGPSPAISRARPTAPDGATRSGPPLALLAPTATVGARTREPVGPLPTTPASVRPLSTQRERPTIRSRAPQVPTLSTAEGGPLRISEFSCAPLEDAEPHALSVTYAFDAAEGGAPYPVHIRLQGRRVLDDDQHPGAGDTFTSAATVPVVHPGSGRVSVTTRVKDISPGRWEVQAFPEDGGSGDPRVLQLRAGSATGHTSFAPVLAAKSPGVSAGAWPALVGLGAVAGVSVQLVLAARAGLSVGAALGVSVLACLLGVAGAKVYSYFTQPPTHRTLITAGMCIQGFVLAAVTTVVVGSLLADLPLGELLDITSPALLTGMAIGRVGCLLGGCCVGRPTASRWGVWTSDRSLGMRRIPVQLLESAMAAVLAATTLAVLLLASTPGRGTVFLAGIAAYTFGRQLLFPLRNIERRTSFGRPVLIALTAAVVIISVALTLL